MGEAHPFAKQMKTVAAWGGVGAAIDRQMKKVKVDIGAMKKDEIDGQRLDEIGI